TPSFSTRPCLPSGLNGVSPRIISAGHKPASQQRRNPGVPEVLEVHGLSGVTDLLVHIVARNAEDLYRIAGQILDIDGVEKTTTGLVMRRLVDYRLSPLLASAQSTGK
ncbi:Lrp/AsnC ligand binding domain-containing protein, partial [Mycobacterium marinum]